MRASLVLLCIAGLVCQAHAQNNNNSSANAGVSTILSTSVGLGPDRQTTSQVITSLVTLQPSASATPAGNTSTAGPSGNSTSPPSAGNSTSSSTTTPSNLPTADSSVNGGGNPAGAPSPGGGSGAYGPGDGYIAGALLLKANAALVVAAGVAVGFAVAL